MLLTHYHLQQLPVTSAWVRSQSFFSYFIKVGTIVQLLILYEISPL